MKRFNFVLTCIFAVVAALLTGELLVRIYIPGTGGIGFQQAHVGLAQLFGFAALVGWAICTIQTARGDGETRCRKCSHILRGLSQARCPECGETI